MKKVILFAISSMVMVSCGEKELTPQEQELQRVTELIDLYQAKSDSSSTRMWEVIDSITHFIVDQGVVTDTIDAKLIAYRDFQVTLEEVNVEFWDREVANAKQEQLRLATLVAAMK